MPVSENYLSALKTPITLWGESKVINPEIALDEFTIEFDNVGTCSLRVYVNTPRMQMYSVGSEDDVKNQRDLQFMTDLYSSQEVMRKYATGETWGSTEIEERFQHFTNNWQVKKSPFSGFMCYNEDEQVGLFNIDWNGKPGVAEFAAVSALQHWKKGFASEVGLLLYKYPKMIRDAGYKLGDGSELHSVTATARPDNGSAFVMERLGLTCTGIENKYGADRKVFLNTVDELQQVVDNSNFRDFGLRLSIV